jgi:hypothetical protein
MKRRGSQSKLGSQSKRDGIPKTALEKKWAKDIAAHKAPLVEVDPLELTDARLNPEEAVIKEREDLLRIESKKKLIAQDELEKVERSEGPRIHYTDLIRRLRKLNPGIRGKHGMEGSVAIYIKKRPDEYTEADILGEPPPNGIFFVDHKYIGGFKKDAIPEWGYVTVDSSHVAVREFRGWRSILIQLVKAKVITYRKAVDEFGDPTLDARSYQPAGWFDQLNELSKKEILCQTE